MGLRSTNKDLKQESLNNIITQYGQKSYDTFQQNIPKTPLKDISMVMSPYSNNNGKYHHKTVNKSMWTRSDIEKAGNMKADLVRNELLTRSDLMKLY
jgi:hypothetical protein